MNMDTLVQKGQRPWWPSPRVRGVDVWHEYDIPTAGVLELEHCSVLFTVVGETDERLSVWAYTSLTEDERHSLANLQVNSIQDLRDLVDDTFEGRDAVFALADDLKVVRWSPVRVESCLVEAASDFLSQVLKAIETNRAPADRFQAKLAEVEAATVELVDA